MDMGHYVNASFDEGRNGPEDRGHSHSGRSTVVWLVGVSFGLLCIIQSALNVCLRLKGTGFCNQSDVIYSDNFTLISAANTSARLHETERLTAENRELQAINSFLLSSNELLNEWLSRQKHLITQLETDKEKLLKRLFETQIHACPTGWSSYLSSCYQLSTEEKSWRHAKDDCVAKGAHLVTLNDEWEEGVLRTLGSSVVWIGLYAKQNGRMKNWTWVDQSQLTHPNRIQQLQNHNFYCAYSEQHPLGVETWVPAACEDRHHWLCEREMK
ncbi:C-type lectin domain family 1 member B-like [Chaetodon trifascialis]|uniref:C-type lectin domain family 1 member B-like n=1 Tax=Chaetodon trifascialis TaxID=109706 RepID=UPI0039939280